MRHQVPGVITISLKKQVARHSDGGGFIAGVFMFVTSGSLYAGELPIKVRLTLP